MSMGIRYYAYPITADEYLLALERPRAFIGDDPLMDAWGPILEQPEMLYLDKCWSDLQLLLGPLDGQPERPAFQLVDGQVTHIETGWIPFERVLSPAQVQEVAADLATVTDTDVRRIAALYPRSNAAAWTSDLDDVEIEREYIAHHLAAAQSFTARLASDGRGLVYLIG